jgi:hypothetical protein
MTTVLDMKVRLAIVRGRIDELRQAVTEYFDLVSEERSLEHALQWLYEEKDGIKIERLPPGEPREKREKVDPIRAKNLKAFQSLTPEQQKQLIARLNKA